MKVSRGLFSYSTRESVRDRRLSHFSRVFFAASSEVSAKCLPCRALPYLGRNGTTTNFPPRGEMWCVEGKQGTTQLFHPPGTC